MMKKLFERAAQTPLRSLLLFSVALTILGCGGGDEDVKTSDNKDSKNKTKAKAASSGGASADEQAAHSVFGVPLDVYRDVYFDNPLEVASATGQAPTPTVDTDNGGPDKTNMTPTTPEVVETPAAGGAVAWDKIISAEMLNSEFKALRNNFKQRLTSLASYNSSYLELPIFGMTLSVLAEIGRQHPGELRWKENAKYIRTLGVEIADVCGGAQARGRKSYDQVNKAFLTISDILDGNSPAGLPEDVEDEAAFVDFADMSYLMKRLNLSMDWMQSNTGSEDSFKDNADKAQREVSVIAAIGHIFSVDSLGYADDDPVFTNHAKTMRDNAKKMFDAAKLKNFTEYDTLRSKVDQECTTCHMGYRTG
jgi:hypothetical protein